MPGLVGTTLKRGSHLAAMRGDITLNTDTRTTGRQSICILTLKLFNMVAAELGPDILRGRVYIQPEDFEYLKRIYPALSRPDGMGEPSKWIEIDLPDHG